jgi:hypothetical protein
MPASQNSIVGESLDRRAALSLFSAIAVASVAGVGGGAGASTGAPWLASPEQIEAESLVLRLMQDPEVLRLQAKLKTDLAATPRGQMKDAAARLDEAIAQWTRSLIFAEVLNRPDHPALLWATDDTPRTWLGHTLGGVGASGDNPDAVYRMSRIVGEGRYEILGQLDPARRPTQLVFEVDGGDMTQPGKMTGQDVQTMASMLTDRELDIAPDGSFRILVGGPAEGRNHMATRPGPCSFGVRDILGDWSQRASRLSIRRLDPVPATPFGLETVKAGLLADLDGYVRFWAGFPDMWFGGLAPNTTSPARARYGGFGAVAGMCFRLTPDQAIVVQRVDGGAAYMGFQMIDPWMIAPDARRHQVCLNRTQSVPSADGSYTYVISPTDPGVANWLDTAGLSDGLGVMRWQAVPQDFKPDGLIRDFRVVSLAEVAKMDLPRVSAEERRQALAKRAMQYESRAR